jgi:hypothetical protein
MAACALIFTAGCSSSPKSTLFPNPGPYNPRQTPASSAAVTFSNLPKADPNVPDTQFVELNSGDQTGAVFYALSGLPPDYEKLATAASQGYRSTAEAGQLRPE